LHRGDCLRRGVHLLLALYLLPAVLAVLVLGGLLVLLERGVDRIHRTWGLIRGPHGRVSVKRCLMIGGVGRPCDF
jgi:hypothetical protein